MTDAPVVLLHAGVADHRMWDDVVPALHDAGRKIVAPDLRGYGDRAIGVAPYSHSRDVLALLDALGIERADLVGASMGGMVALEVAAVAPERVRSLALLSPALSGWEWSRQFARYTEDEEAALERGDLDTAVRLNLRAWADGAGPAIEDYVARAARRSFELAAEGGADEEELDPPVHERLDTITARTLIVAGNRDFEDFPAIARHLAERISGAELRTIEGAGHLVALERPDEIGSLLAAWLRDEE